MDIKKVFHMIGGIGETSYAANSSLQKGAIDMVKHITTESIVELYLATAPQNLVIADLGCSSGPNTLSVIGEIIDAIDRARLKFMVTSRRTEIQVFLNDLPSNDFNSVFLAWPSFFKEKLSKCNGRNDFERSPVPPPFVSIAGVPGSFYGRLFPTDSLHFIHSSFSLHWLSRVPVTLYDEDGKSMNKGKIYISESSPHLVSEAYLIQFQEDFSLFLRSRSLSSNPEEEWCSSCWEGLVHIILRVLMLYYGSFSPVPLGDIDEEKLNSFDTHFYAPSQEEIEEEVRKEGSFAIDRLEVFEMRRDIQNGSSTYGTTVATTVRAIQESMIRHHFGEHIVNDLFEIYGRLIDEEMTKGEIRPIASIVAMRKRL
ncbi:hypothetical protein NE237_000021 [Protea cynaroides]|uniref:Uncharacterized protein n=1 Tax=Protea cynaroides TaxID=273540 RepID=A0A9Q0GPS3_9MAGN|nr:hypothetical protein NE237_000021 [Protea cynaroides]